MLLLYILNKQLFVVNRDRLYTDTRLNNAYNLDLIDCICDIYITLCYEYDKEVSISGFSKLTGIDTDTVNSWGREETRVGSKGSVIYKKIEHGKRRKSVKHAHWRKEKSGRNIGGIKQAAWLEYGTAKRDGRKQNVYIV